MLADVWVPIVSAVVGAVLTGAVSLFIYNRSVERPSGDAYVFLRKLGKQLEKPAGRMYRTGSSNDNFKIANYIYDQAQAKLIATSFNEDPSTYGERDLARVYASRGRFFTRITAEDICPPDAQSVTRVNMEKYVPGSRLVVVPVGSLFTRVDGIFCRFEDDTYLAFVSFRNPADSRENAGVVFCDGIANGYFSYYDDLAGKYGSEVTSA
ncbi:MAG: hypothetical protein AAB353_13845 [Candidatus Hydrogenedentota bacterium]